MENKKGTEKKGTDTSLAKKEMSQSERFTEMVMKQFTNNAGELALTNYMRKLCQNYFIRIDQTLKDLEKKRLSKPEKYRDELAFDWKNVNLSKLAVDVVSYSSVGLDPTQPNQVNCIPYKNNTTNKFDIGFIIGYKGLELKVKKYGLDIPDDVVVELVYKNDKFKQIKKDINNKVEGYTLEVVDDFNRGEIVGGFYYHVYFDRPERNKLRVFSKADIEKRKPGYASVEFWGGEKDKWENGKKIGKEHIAGWFDEMAYKTIYRAAYNALTIDSQKIDDHYQSVMALEREILDSRVMLEIKENANQGEAIGFEEDKTNAITESSDTEPLSIETNSNEEPQELPEQEEIANETNGPGW